MNDNLSLDLLSKKLDFINDKYQKKLNKIDNNFNNLKNTFLELSSQYENKIQFENKDNIQTNSDDNNDNNYLSQLSEMLNDLLSEERNNNINYINSCLNKYNMNPSLLNGQSNIKEYVENFGNELNQIMAKLDEKIENIKMEKNNNIELINIEMNNEINNLFKKINDTSLDLIVSNSDKANAIQDIIKIYLNKFKVSKNEYNEFEDKLTKLISELLEKIILLKKGQ